MEQDIQARVEQWRTHVTDKALADELQQLIASNDETKLYDAFYRDLEFGTAGLRVQRRVLHNT